MKPIAIAVYVKSGDIYKKPLFTEKELSEVRSGDDLEAGDHPTVIVMADLTTEDWT